MKLPYAFAAPYGDIGRNGVDSVCGVSAGTPNTSPTTPGTSRIDGSTARIASSSAVTPTAPSSRRPRPAAPTSAGTNDGEARL